MKKFTLILTLLLAFVSIGFSQDFGGTPPTCTNPAGYTFGQGAQVVPYNNPLKNGCTGGDDDCGIVTPGVGGSNPANIIFPPQTVTSTTTSITKCFNIFVFDANLKCESNKDFPCSTFVTAYIVLDSYNATQAPSSSEYYGVSEKQLVRAFGSINCVTASFSSTPDPNQQYRIFLDFTNDGTCLQQNTKYVIDILPLGAPTPVNLSSFLAGRTGSAVSLNWKTEIEMTAINFEVQRSYDNSSFNTIATVAGVVNGASTKSYSYVDNNNTSKSISFYRLKIVKPGEVSYSDIKTVKGLAGKAGFVIFPNPSVGNARITISDLSEPTRVQLLDNSGRIVKSLILNNTNSVELNGLQKGTYMVRIIGSESGHTEIRKLTVIN